MPPRQRKEDQSSKLKREHNKLNHRLEDKNNESRWHSEWPNKVFIWTQMKSQHLKSLKNHFNKKMNLKQWPQMKNLQLKVKRGRQKEWSSKAKESRLHAQHGSSWCGADLDMPWSTLTWRDHDDPAKPLRRCARLCNLKRQQAHQGKERVASSQ